MGIDLARIASLPAVSLTGAFPCTHAATTSEAKVGPRLIMHTKGQVLLIIAEEAITTAGYPFKPMGSMPGSD